MRIGQWGALGEMHMCVNVFVRMCVYLCVGMYSMCMRVDRGYTHTHTPALP